ncbi:MAG: hypothetical protein KJ941_03050, partial [Bacteroidetes bacterium]|nr:hypothetical protein [Bacteroidota bacterium]
LNNIEVVFSRNIKNTDDEAKKTFNTFTDQDGNYVLTTKANIRKAHKVTIKSVSDTNYFLIGNYNNGLFSKTSQYQFDLAVARVLSANFYYVDSSLKNTSPESKLHLQFRHEKINGFYLEDSFVYRSEGTSFPIVSFPILEGWTYIKGKTVRFNGQELDFVDSIYASGKNLDVINHYKKY